MRGPAAFTDGFRKGYICAVSTLVGEYPGLADEARRVLACGGFLTLEDVLAARPDDFDAEVVARVYERGCLMPHDGKGEPPAFCMRCGAGMAES